MKTAVKKKTKVGRKPSKALAVVIDKPPQSMPEVIWRATKDPSVDVGKLKELIALQREMADYEAKMQFEAALAQAQKEMPPVIKDAVNTHTKSAYAKLETVSKTIDKIIHTNGFSLSYGMADSSIPNHYRITCRLSRAGYNRDYFVDLPADVAGPQGSANKNPTQGAGSTISYARRYLKIMIFDVRVAGEDDDGNAAWLMPITEKQVKLLTDLSKEVGVEEGKMCEWLEIKSYKEMPTLKFAQAISALEKRRTK